MIATTDVCTLVRLSDTDLEAAVDTLAEAFHDYAAMRFMLRDAGAYYDHRLRALVRFFTASRFERGYPVLGVRDSAGRLLAVANINPPRGSPMTDQLRRLYDATKQAIGPAAVRRMDEFSRACASFEPAQPHYHLGMIGVQSDARGRGLARLLIEAVMRLSVADPESQGVGLTTEDPHNLPFYEHFGFDCIGRAAAQDLHTWGFYRPDVATAAVRSLAAQRG